MIGLADNAEEKRRIRRAMRAERRALGAVVQRRHALQLRTHLQYRSWYQNARTLGMYWAADGEISVEPLMRLSWALGKRVYLPTLDRQRAMSFRLLRPGDPLHINRYGIGEPRSSAPTADPAELDIIFVPVVAFTSDGSRLGMGGGYYDRVLSGHSDRLRPSAATRPKGAGKVPGNPRVVGVAHSFQRAETLPRDEWDVTMHLVVTEKGVLRT